VIKSGYVLWSVVTGIGLLGVRTFGNPLSNEVQYRVEYIGKAGSTLWGDYTVTQNNRTRDSNTEKAVGKLPLVINFTTGKNAIVSANGSTTDQEPVIIKIYKHGSECSNSQGTDLAGITNTTVCR
jgi:hypothetical protein